MEEKTFTQALNNLQVAATEIGKQATSIEESLKLFESGMKEAEFLNSILDNADQQIKVYSKESQDA